MIFSNKCLLVLGLMIIPSSGWGAITYVDADSSSSEGVGNTTIDGAFVVTAAGTDRNATTGTGAGNNSDNFWHIRTGGNFNTGADGIVEVWTAVSDTEVVSPLVTTISLPAAGTYNLYGYFWNNQVGGELNAGSWDSSFSLDGGVNFTVFDRTNATLLEPADPDGLHNSVDFTTPVRVRTSTTSSMSSALLQASLGQVTVDEPSNFAVYVQSPVGTLTGATQTLYEGVGYELAPILVPGDFDSDGDVDGADFVAWQTNFPKAMEATLAEGDADADGDVDGADFVVWQTNFPFTPGLGSSVPEPASMIPMLAGLAVLVCGRMRR